MSFETYEIIESIKMIQLENLDIRTSTMGISLKDCMDSNIDKVCQKIYNKVTTYAKDLVKTANEVSNIYGIPIVNKRIAVTPISLVAESVESDDYVKIAKTLDRAANELGVDFIGGYSCLVHKGMSKGDIKFIDSIPFALSETKRVCSSVNVGKTSAGINMNAVYKIAKMMKKTAFLTKDQDSIGCAKFVVFMNAVEDNPFMAGAFHGIGEGEVCISVGISGPGVVASALKNHDNLPMDEIAEIIKKTSFKITRMGEMVGKDICKRLNVPFGIIDLSLAPTPAIGDSVAEILELIGLSKVGAHGTIAALAMLNDSVKKGGVMATTNVGGLSGAFIPVSEDAGMIDAVRDGVLELPTLNTMTAVCSVGLDMIAVPGDITEETLAAIIADQMAIGLINNKTTAARIIPAYGKKVGDEVNFGGLLGAAPIMRVKDNHNADIMIKRGGRVPAPIHSLKN
jgi:uncharacterized protein (UPF0210 family)